MLTCLSECLTLKSYWGLQSAQTQSQPTVRNKTPAAVRQPQVCISIHLQQQQQQAESTSIISTCWSTADSGELTGNIRDKEGNDMWQRSPFEPGMLGGTRTSTRVSSYAELDPFVLHRSNIPANYSVEHRGYQLQNVKESVPVCDASLGTISKEHFILKR